MRLRKEFEDSIQASRIDHEQASPGRPPAGSSGPPAGGGASVPQEQSFGEPRSRRPLAGSPEDTHPHLPAATARRAPQAIPARYPWVNIAGIAAACALASLGAWAATIGLARLVWKFSGF